MQVVQLEAEIVVAPVTMEMIAEYLLENLAERRLAFGIANELISADAAYFQTKSIVDLRIWVAESIVALAS